MEPYLDTPLGLRLDRWSILALGLNAWLVIAVWPLLFSQAWEVWKIYLLLPSPVLLTVGISCLRNRKELAQWILLAAFPTSIIAVPASRSETDNLLDYTPVLLLFAVLSLSAYAAFTAGAISRYCPIRESETKPIQLLSWYGSTSARLWTQRLIIGLTLVGAFCVVLIGPYVGSSEELKRDWGSAAMQGGLLVASVAVALASTVIVTFLGSALCARDEPLPSKSNRLGRLVSALLLSLVGFLTYFLIQQP